jgi:hypothetical protein
MTTLNFIDLLSTIQHVEAAVPGRFYIPAHNSSTTSAKTMSRGERTYALAREDTRMVVRYGSAPLIMDEIPTGVHQARERPGYCYRFHVA